MIRWKINKRPINIAFKFKSKKNLLNDQKVIKYFVPSIGISQIVGLDKKNHYVVASLKDSSLYFFELKENKEIINMNRIEIGERIRDMIKYNNELYLFLEDTASFAQVILK